MRILAWLATMWAAYRWLGLLVGLLRSLRLRGPVRREALRSCVARTSWNVFWTVVAFFVWVQAAGLHPRPETFGLAAMLLMVSLATGTAVFFMQPQERSLEALNIFRLVPARVGSTPDAPADPDS